MEIWRKNKWNFYLAETSYAPGSKTHTVPSRILLTGNTDAGHFLHLFSTRWSSTLGIENATEITLRSDYKKKMEKTKWNENRLRLRCIKLIKTTKRGCFLDSSYDKMKLVMKYDHYLITTPKNIMQLHFESYDIWA